MIPEEAFHFMILAGAELVKRKSRYVNRERERELLSASKDPFSAHLRQFFLHSEDENKNSSYFFYFI